MQSRVEQKPFVERSQRVVFGARWDQEKQPQFFMDLATKFKEKHPEVEFAICSGAPLRSNNDYYVKEAKYLEKQKILTIHENLQKNEYYNILADSRVLFNCALQDWTSNTLSEADVLVPMYCRIPASGSVFNDHKEWRSIEDAMAKLDIIKQTIQ